jgi:uncharacterized small protein (DUF1192 family)
MPKRSPDPAPDADRYALFDQLDRLEELLEDMIALEIRSMDELEQRIEALNAQIDAAEAPDESQ